jgi:hypothetical protein
MFAAQIFGGLISNYPGTTHAENLVLNTQFVSMNKMADVFERRVARKMEIIGDAADQPRAGCELCMNLMNSELQHSTFNTLEY